MKYMGKKNSAYVDRRKMHQQSPLARVSSLSLYRAPRLSQSKLSGPYSLPHVPRCLSLGCHNKIPLIGGLKQHKFIFHNSGGWKVQNQGPVGFSSGESSPPGLQKTIILLCPHKVERASKFSSYKALIPS